METSYVNKITGFVIALVLGSILIGGMLAPTVAGIQDTVGNPIAYNNGGAASGGAVFDEIKNDTIVYEVSTTGVTVNGSPLTWNVESNWPTIIYTDGGYVTVRSTFEAVGFQKVNLETNSFDGINVNVVEGTPVIVTVGNNTVTVGENSFTFTKGYYWTDSVSTDKYFLALDLTVRVGTWYVNDLTDLIAYGMYTTGDNDCYYELINGALSTNGEYTTGVNATLTKVNGTTDIYQLTDFTLSVGDESFTPYLCLIPAQIHGHATAGTYFVMFGVITMLAIVMLVVYAASAIKSKY